jgi:CRISPR-associated protein Cas2
LNVIVLECATPALRGQLTRWMLEVRAGVYVGTLTARVRQKLWELVCARSPEGGALLVFRAPNEQGFIVESHGDTSRSVIDNEGMQLVRRPLEDAVRAPAAPKPPAAPRVRKRRQRA